MLAIFQSMRDSPDEITRKQYALLEKLHSDSAWMIRHAIGKDHPYSPITCGGCKMTEKFLKDNPE